MSQIGRGCWFPALRSHAAAGNDHPNRGLRPNTDPWLHTSSRTSGAIGGGRQLILRLANVGALLLVIVAIRRSKERTVSRVEGGALVGSYVVFLAVSALRTLGG